MNFEKYSESINKYSDHEGIFENELVAPLEENNDMEELFERIYYECNIKPLFERVLALREAESNGQSSKILDQIKTRIETKLKNFAIEMKFVPFSIENYNKLLGSGVDTPCGHVKFGENQYLKLGGRDSGGRQNLIWATRQTLEDPIVVIHNDAPTSTLHESLTYAKSFTYQDNKRHRNPVKTIRSFILLYNEDNERVEISSGQARIEQILNIIKKPDDIVYEKK